MKKAERYLMLHTPLLLQEIEDLRDEIFDLESQIEQTDEEYLYRILNVNEVAALRRDIKRIKDKIIDFKTK